MPRRQGEADRAGDLASLSRPALEALAIESGISALCRNWKDATIIRHLKEQNIGNT